MKISIRRYFTQSLLVMSALFLFLSLNGCSPDYSETIQPSKKTAQPVQNEIDQQPILPVVQTPPPEPLSAPVTVDDSQILRVGVFQNASPFIYHINEKIEGLEADLALQLGEFTGKTIQFITVPKNKAAEALQNKRVDILMSGLKITNGKENSIFSDAYLRSGLIMLIRVRDKSLFSNGIYSLEKSGLTLGVIEGSAGDLFLTRNIRGVRIMRFKTVDSAIQALILKKIYLFLHDAPTICRNGAANTSAGLVPVMTLVTEEYLGWEMRKEDKELRRQVNQFIQQSKVNGQLQKTIKHWIPNIQSQ